MCNGNMIVLERKEVASDKEVEAELKVFLKELKDSGTKKINIIDLLMRFSHPAHQMERVMDGLEKKGLVKEGF